MEEKKITRDEFDEAVKKATEIVMNKTEFEGMAKFLVPLTGNVFAREIRDILFPDETEVDEK